MLKIDRRLVQNVDWLLLASALAVVGVGLVTLGYIPPSRGGSVIVWRQLVWVGLGLIALTVAASTHYRSLVRAAPAFYILGLGLLVAVLVLGRTVSGARRWLPLGLVSVQPAEVFKLVFILALVWLLTSRWAQLPARGMVWPALGILALPTLLIIKQPDLGSAVVLVPVPWEATTSYGGGTSRGPGAILAASRRRQRERYTRLRSRLLKAAYDGTVGRLVAGGAARLVATSALERAELVEDGVRPDRVAVRANGIGEDVLTPAADGLRARLGVPPEAPVVLALGRIARKKNHPAVARAVAVLPGVM